MSYGTLEDMFDRFGKDEMLQVAGTGPRDERTLNQRQVTAGLEDATELIDSYLRGRFDLPLSRVPSLLVGLACDIARHELRARASGGRAQMADIVRQRYEDALNLLKEIAKGRATLGLKGGDAETTSDSRAFRVVSTGKESFLDRTALKQW